MTKSRRGIASLIIASLIWGTSFPAMKISVSGVGEFTYTWMRATFAIIMLLPYIFVRRREIDRGIMKAGFLAGLTYAMGIWLQGWGTKFTTASNSAFITGLYMVFVHLYVALMIKRYSPKLSLSLILAISGLYMLARPDLKFNVGDFLVLLSALFWAANILIIDRYSDKNPVILTFFEMIPSVFFILPDISTTGLPSLNLNQLMVLMYLGFACSNGATIFQIYGQRFIEPASASVIYLFEPVFAAIFSFALLGEIMKIHEIAGASLILLAMLVASTEKMIVKS